MQNFNNYTEYDEGNDVTVESATKVSWVNLRSRYDTAYLYKNFGTAIFNGDFTHKFEMGFSNVGNSAMLLNYMLCSYLGDFKGLIDAGGDAVYVQLYDDTENIYAGFLEAGVANNDGWLQPGPQASTNYFITVVRDDDGGDNGTGLLTVHICTGNYYGLSGYSEEDELTIHASAGEQNDYQSAFALATYDDNGTTNTCDGYTQNLNLGFGIVLLRRRLQEY